MSSLFDQALMLADQAIEDVMMSTYLINGEGYQAVYDEIPKEFEPMNGVVRTLTLYKTQGYEPRKNDIVQINGIEYLVTSFTVNDGLIILQLEENAKY
ncbi:hypothetical protein [Pasteurella multocida]|uniref:hypothetical protein n=1 Tax=Pasteurella multocida TaxID=747 RepID=UPI001F535FB2|nr:hypothetical protein [Pasteurella multocida]